MVQVLKAQKGHGMDAGEAWNYRRPGEATGKSITLFAAETLVMEWKPVTEGDRGLAKQCSPMVSASVPT